ncbi:hypothetical protein NFI96_034342 [Prochilodus magdalenae]|nr:hypothetical protein NFI96_034342 [Prochilodus magdalenae]
MTPRAHQRLSQESGLKIEMLCHDLKQAVHARKTSDVAELKEFSTEEWARIPSLKCERLIASYGKDLNAVAAAKCGTTGY